jgi:membrane protease YdiL (CAAX protease family)
MTTETRYDERPGSGVDSPWVFFGTTYALTWAWWLAAIVLGVSFDSAAGAGLLLLGLVGPGVAGVGFVSLVYGERGRADVWNRVRQVRRIGPRWFVVILLVPVAVTVVAAVAESVLGGSGVAWGEAVRGVGVDPLAMLPTLFYATLPPLLEELGWRGYALDRLQMDWSAAGAGVILGAVWAVWHLPLFFVEGSFQHEEVGFATTGFWLFMVGIVALSVVTSWVYNNTSRSVLGAVALHGWVNAVSDTVDVADEFYYPVWMLSAVIVVAVWGAKTLTSDDDVPRPPPETE